ncbi:CLUMA_CG020415, isoform A, partial [Clunio marinus]
MKILSLCLKLDSIKTLKSKILEDVADTTEEEMKIERKYRKYARVLIFFTAVIYLFTSIISFLTALGFKSDTAMFVNIQIPWTIPNTHPSREINLMMTTFYQIIGVIIVVGCDSFFNVLTFHCVAKMDVCCSEVSKINGKTDKKFISNLVEKHFRVLEIIRISEEVLNPICFHQLVTTFGVLVCTGFNIKAKANYVSLVFLMSALFQFYFYCFLGNYVSSM